MDFSEQYPRAQIFKRWTEGHYPKSVSKKTGVSIPKLSVGCLPLVPIAIANGGDELLADHRNLVLLFNLTQTYFPSG
jgi:hypothetical protein